MGTLQIDHTRSAHLLKSHQQSAPQLFTVVGPIVRSRVINLTWSKARALRFPRMQWS